MALDPITAALDIGGKLIDRLFPDKTAAAQAKLQLLQLQQSGELAQLTQETDIAKGQLAINQAEAANNNLFVAGWRPFIGWVCGAALAYDYVLQPFLHLLLSATGVQITLPVLDLSTMMPIVATMLGMGYLRSWDKKNGVSSGQ